jgi:hypothetical protein
MNTGKADFIYDFRFGKGLWMRELEFENKPRILI